MERRDAGTVREARPSEAPKVTKREGGGERGPRTGARTAFFALNLLSSRLLFGPDGRIRLNALIKLLTSFGRLGGHRVSADWPEREKERES